MNNSSEEILIGIDQGTTGTTILAVDSGLNVLESCYAAHRQNRGGKFCRLSWPAWRIFSNVWAKTPGMCISPDWRIRGKRSAFLTGKQAGLYITR